ncbi:anti-sigma factor RsbA family regulatory protein [Geodermatophilus sp. CPCC 206100]|uniref:anti-sigma factor RsbA family regulatory protein n=1 Tax=Geodermatophilus sp. CPCC 206100 TaxID=3020054 RepID=UPI003B005453
MGEVPSGGCGSAPASRYRHDALLYDSLDALAGVTAPFLGAGLDAGEAAVVAAGPSTAAAVCAAVGDDPRLVVVDRTDASARRTPTAITTFRRLADRLVAAGVTRIRVVGEIDVGRTGRDWLEWQRYEAALNHALADWPLWSLCVFDRRRLPDPVLASVLATHPVLVSDGDRRPNPAFVDPARYLRELPVPPEPLEGTPPRLDVRGVTDFIGLRHAVAAELGGVRGDRALVEDFLLAVDEMTSNAVRHGRPPVDLALWISRGSVVCRIRDRGPGPDDPFAGYGPAHGDDLSRGGMGLWLARQLCDHVDITRDPDGVVVRLTTNLD